MQCLVIGNKGDLQVRKLALLRCGEIHSFEKKHILYENMCTAMNYRASQVIVQLDWVDLDLGCSTTLPGQ